MLSKIKTEYIQLDPEPINELNAMSFIYRAVRVVARRTLDGSWQARLRITTDGVCFHDMPATDEDKDAWASIAATLFNLRNEDQDATRAHARRCFDVEK
jgi:hypothetical protein